MFSSNLSLDLLQDQRLWELLLLELNAADVWRTQESQGYICWNTSLKTPTPHHHLHHSMRIMGIKTGIWIWSRGTVCGTQHIYDGCFLVKMSLRQTISNCSIVLRLLIMTLTHGPPHRREIFQLTCSKRKRFLDSHLLLQFCLLSEKCVIQCF